MTNTTPSKKTDLSGKTALVIDNGLFIELAITLGKSFGKVFYHTEWKSAFPKSNDMLIGDGIDEVERVKHIWEVMDEVDIVIFPDVYDGPLQSKLVSLGKRVWGGRYGEEMELERWKFKKLLKKIGLPVAHAEHITGTEDLKKYLKEHENVWIKVSTVRGDFETFQSESFDLSEPKVNELEHKLGAKAKIAKFIVEDDLPDRIEIGYDGYTIDGQFPSVAMQAFEIKDLGAVGRVKKYEDMAEPVKFVNDKLSPLFRNYEYRGWFSSEIRYGEDKEPYLIDPCCRLASPPSEMYLQIYDNWDQIIWNGADGTMTDPNPIAEYGVEVMIHSPWADHNWQAIDFPDELRPYVKLRNLTKIEDKYYVVPTDVGLPEIGAVIGLGDTLDEAVEMCKHNCNQVRGYFLECKLESIDKGMEEIEKAKALGIEF